VDIVLSGAVSVASGGVTCEFARDRLRWAVKRFDEALPRLDGEVRETIAGMRASHLRSIESCESVARTLAEDVS